MDRDAGCSTALDWLALTNVFSRVLNYAEVYPWTHLAATGNPDRPEFDRKSSRVRVADNPFKTISSLRQVYASINHRGEVRCCLDRCLFRNWFFLILSHHLHLRLRGHCCQEDGQPSCREETLVTRLSSGKRQSSGRFSLGIPNGCRVHGIRLADLVWANFRIADHSLRTR